jgi:hypothetical protein
MSTDALVVGQSVHTRIEARRRLRAEGFHVTVEKSAQRGLARLARHRFAVCAIDLTDVPGARTWKRHYGQAARSSDTELRDLSGRS